MLLHTIFFITTLWTVHVQGDWEPCGSPSGCYCSRPVLHQLHCRNITVFPLLDDNLKPGVLSISIRDSNIAGLPPFQKEQWDRLRDITFINTPLMSCCAISDLQQQGLRVLSDLQCQQSGNVCHRSKAGGGGGICLASLLLLIISLTVGLIFNIYMTLCKRDTSRHQRDTACI